MIYSNTNLKAEEREFSFGKMFVIALGESGRGRKEIILPCPEGITIKKGLNEDLSIGFSKSGKPKIVQAYDCTMFYLLSSYGGYTRRGNGIIKVLNEDETSTFAFSTSNCLAYGNGADGDAGRIGDWDVVLLSDPKKNIAVRYSGGGFIENLSFIIGSVEIPNLELEGALDAGMITEEQFLIAKGYRDRNS